MTRLASFLVVVGVLLFAIAAGSPLSPAVAQANTTASDVSIRGEPDLTVSTPEPTLSPDGPSKLTLQITNDGDLEWGGPAQRDAVVTARDVRVEANAPAAPFEIQTGEVGVGSVGEDRPATVDLTVAVPSNASAGTYEVDVEVSYSHVSQYWTSGSLQLSQEHSHTIEETVTVTIEDRPRFSFEHVETDALVGTAGTLEGTVRNIGSETASDVDLTVRGSESIQVGDGESSVFLGDLEPNQSRSFAVETTVTETATGGEKPIAASIEYENELGQRVDPVEISSSVVVRDSQTFAIEAVSDTLRVGFDGTVTGRVINEGPRTVSDGVLVIDPRTDSLYVEDTMYALPRLEPGETASFEYPTDVSGDADAGPRQVQFTVEYRDDETTYTSANLPASVEIDPYRKAFGVTGIETDLTVGEPSTVVLEVTNQRSVAVRNVDALVYTDSPLESPGDEAFVSELRPGETAKITFEIEATGDARETTYPIELDFEYETPTGTSQVSDTEQIAVDVSEPADDGGIDRRLVVVGIGALLVTLAGLLAWRRY